MKSYLGELSREDAQKFMWNFLGHVAYARTKVGIQPIKTNSDETCPKVSILLKPEETYREILEDFLYYGQPHRAWLGIKEVG